MLASLQLCDEIVVQFLQMLKFPTLLQRCVKIVINYALREQIKEALSGQLLIIPR